MIERCFRGEWSVQQIDELMDRVRSEFPERYAAYEKYLSLLRDECLARAARPSLEEVTLNQNDFSDSGGEFPEYHENNIWRVTENFYSSGVCEVRASIGNVSTGPREKSSLVLVSAEELDGATQKARFESSISRAKKTLRSRCLELNVDHLLTLTKRGKFESIDDAWCAFKEFSRLMGLRFGAKWRYVVVPELHADGETYHLHVGIRGFFMAETVRLLWQKALGGKGNERGEQTLGNVDLKNFKGGNRVTRVRRIAGYIAKYIGKGFTTCNRGRRLFASSRGLDPHRVVRRLCRFGGGIREFALAMQEGVLGDGSSGNGTCYFWSRQRRDGSMMSCGFILSTDWSGVSL
jgi:hypothetical protein